MSDPTPDGLSYVEQARHDFTERLEKLEQANAELCRVLAELLKDVAVLMASVPPVPKPDPRQDFIDVAYDWARSIWAEPERPTDPNVLIQAALDYADALGWRPS
jgi:hypothetical protein